jgi:hypothetical protein
MESEMTRSFKRKRQRMNSTDCHLNFLIYLQSGVYLYQKTRIFLQYLCCYLTMCEIIDIQGDSLVSKKKRHYYSSIGFR